MSHSILTQTVASVDAHREKTEQHHQDKTVAAALYGLQESRTTELIELV